jgi:hypothetical protein
MAKSLGALLLMFAVPSLATPEVYAQIDASIITSLNTSTGEQAFVGAIPAGATGYLPGPGSEFFIQNGNGSITGYNTSAKAPVTYQLTYTIVGGMAVSTDGQYLYVGTCDIELIVGCTTGYLEEFSTSSPTEIQLLELGDQVSGLAMSPSGSTLYVSHYSVFSCPQCVRPRIRNAVPSDALTAFSIPSLTPGLSLSSPNPGQLVIDQGGLVGYLTNGSQILSLNLEDLTVTNQVSSANYAGQLALSQDGSTLCADESLPGNDAANYTMEFFDTTTMTSTGTVPLPQNSYSGPVIDAGGLNCYVGNVWTGLVYDVSSQSLSISRMLPAGAPTSVAYSVATGILTALQLDGNPFGAFQEGSAKPSGLLLTGAPIAITPSPGGKLLYVSQMSGVASYSAATGALVKNYLPGVQSRATAISPNGSTLFIAGESLTTYETTLYTVNALTGAVTNQMASSTAIAGITLSPDGTKMVVMYQGNGYNPSVYYVGEGKFTPIQDSAATSCAIDPTSSFAYLGSGSSIDVVDLATAQVTGTISNLESPIVFSKAGNVAYAFAPGAGAIDVIDTSTSTVTSTIPTPGVTLRSMAITSDGLYIYTSGTNGVGPVIDTATATIIGSIPAVGIVVTN